MKKSIGLLMVAGSLLFGADNLVMPYSGFMKYSGDTTKDNGNVVGVYISSFKSPYKTELDIEHTVITYNDGSSDLKQTDFTGIINYYQGYNLMYRGGIHYISSSDNLTDKGKIFIAGAQYYKYDKYNVGADVYYSYYDNETDSPKIWQFSPKIGFDFGKYTSNIGSFYVEVQATYINSDKNLADSKSTFNSSQISLSNYKGPFSTSIAFWGGKRDYFVDNGGFIVNNLSQEQKGGFKFSENYAINKVSALKFEYTYNKYTDKGDANSKVFLLSYSHSF